MSTVLGGQVQDRRLRRWLAGIAAGLLVGFGTLLGASSAMADDIDPEQYPPPPVAEEPAEQPEPMAEALPSTGAGSSWQWYVAGGAGMLIAGSALLLVRRRFVQD